jgi:hypothetical protein
LVVVALAATLHAGSASARFIVSPSLLSVKKTASGMSLGTINVTTIREQGQQFRVLVQSATQTPSGGYAFGPSVPVPFSAAQWITVSPRRFVGSASGTHVIEYSIRVPANAGPGDYLAAITVERVNLARGHAQLSVVDAIAVRITVRVPGKTRQAVQIGPIAAPALAGGGPVTLVATVRNTGNVLLDFNGRNRASMTVLGGVHVIATMPFIGLLYPGQTRTFRYAWQDPPTLGHPKVRVAVRLSSGERVRTRLFWVLPWRQAAALLLVALAAVVLLLQRSRRRAGRVGDAPAGA